MYVSTVVTIGTDNDGQFELELKVRDRFTATVNVRQVTWSHSVYQIGTERERTYDHLIASGRWRLRSGEWSAVDARENVTEDRLPPYVVEQLHKFKARLGQ